VAAVAAPEEDGVGAATREVEESGWKAAANPAAAASSTSQRGANALKKPALTLTPAAEATAPSPAPAPSAGGWDDLDADLDAELDAPPPAPAPAPVPAPKPALGTKLAAPVKRVDEAEAADGWDDF
jgi:hypothetical protein